MADLYPLVFHPIFKERVWGGRMLESLYGKPLPPGVPVGESWEVSDRPGDESVIAGGPLAGRTLRWVMEHHGSELLGRSRPAGSRFPLLCKILDARDRLSLQVHPPTNDAGRLGEPKTEMWYIARADPGAELYVGLKRGVTRADFERAIANGTVADCFHRIPVQTGDAMFLPSGRVHAIGAGLVIFEIQQNSDTTFRVYDWGRVGLDGKPRQLHVAESLASIDFSDVEPSLIPREAVPSGSFEVRTLVRHALFDADLVHARTAGMLTPPSGRVAVLAVVEGRLTVSGGGIACDLQAGQFCVVPACLRETAVAAPAGTRFLIVHAGES